MIRFLAAFAFTFLLAAPLAEAEDLPEGVSAYYQPAVMLREGNFRAQPSTDNQPIGTYPGGTQVLILGETAEASGRAWYYIALYDGQRGYMAQSLLRPMPQIPTPPDAFGGASVSDEKEYALLVGGHGVTLHWVGWDQPGELIVVEEVGLIYLVGRQEGVGQQVGDWLDINGFVTSIKENAFVLQGSFTYHVASLTGQYTCQRSGVFTFVRPKGKNYWRLQEDKSTCGDYVEYLDIALRDEK